MHGKLQFAEAVLDSKAVAHYDTPALSATSTK